MSRPEKTQEEIEIDAMRAMEREAEEKKRRREAQKLLVKTGNEDEENPPDMPPIDWPETDDVKTLARAATPAAIKALYRIATSSPSDPARVSAANALLDRAWGKPAQAVEHTGKDGAPIAFELNLIDQAMKAVQDKILDLQADGEGGYAITVGKT